MRPPRERLGVFPTPLVRADRLAVALGTPRLLVKRDDLAGFGVAGNKTRPLEFLIGAARAQGAEILVTGGGPGSNFCPASALAASATGLRCELIIAGRLTSANQALAIAAGASVRETAAPRERLDELITARVGELTAGGQRAYGVPRGGSNPVGAVGFAFAATELAAQLGDAQPEVIVLAVGSGGSAAGLLAGLAATDLAGTLLGVSVSRPLEMVRPHVLGLARNCAALLGAPAPDPDRLELVDAVGHGFGVPNQHERALAAVALRTEGLLLDPTYGAKAFAVAVGHARRGRSTVFWHTGGVLPAVAAIAPAERTDKPVPAGGRLIDTEACG
jgi:1-aminocyclopropane-1-carboxylate deaminase/D-cysteine desulfhydrase-like pyridoxal-dependent ACC family enzyme